MLRTKRRRRREKAPNQRWGHTFEEFEQRVLLTVIGGTVGFVPTSVTVVRGQDTAAGLSVKWTADQGEPFSLEWSTIDGSAVAGRDYTAEVNQSLTFADGSEGTTQGISVPILNPSEQVSPGNKQFEVVLHGITPINDNDSPEGTATPATAVAVVTIIDPNTPPPPLPSVSISDGNATAGVDSVMPFTFSLSQPSSSAVSVVYTPRDGSAHDGVDYSLSGGTMTFPPDVTTEVIGVPIEAGNGTGGTKSFYVDLSIPYNATLGKTPGNGTITQPDETISIGDATATQGTDTTADFTVSLSQSTSSTVTVYYTTQDGSATAGEDYGSTTGSVTFQPYATSATISVLIPNETGPEPSQTFHVNLSNPTYGTIGTGHGTGTVITTNETTVPPDQPIPDPNTCGCTDGYDDQEQLMQGSDAPQAPGAPNQPDTPSIPSIPGMPMPNEPGAPAMPPTPGTMTPDASPSISPLNGSLTLHQATTGWGNYQESGLNYDSATVNPHPIVSTTATVPSPPVQGVSLYSVDANWTFNGVPYYTAYYPLSYFGEFDQFPPLSKIDFAYQFDASTLPTATYAWTLNLSYNYRAPGGAYNTQTTVSESLSGLQTVINRTQSPYGSGWWPTGLDQIIAGASAADYGNWANSVYYTYISGDGHAAIYDLNSGRFQHPAGWYNSLTESLGNTSLEFTNPQNIKEQFNWYGVNGGPAQLTDTYDAAGNHTIYNHNNDGTLNYVKGPNNTTTNFAYDANHKLASISLLNATNDPSPETTTVQVTNGQLTTMTEQGFSATGTPQLATTFAYASQTGLMTQLTSSSGLLTTYSYSPAYFGVLNSITHSGDSSTYNVSPAYEGFIADAYGNTGTIPPSLIAPSLTASFTNENGHSYSETLNNLGLVTSITDSAGNTTQYFRDANGRVTRMILPDPDGSAGPRSAPQYDYTYDAVGHLTQISRGTVLQPGLVTFKWTYDPVFGLPTSYIDQHGDETDYVYDQTSGALLKVTQKMNGQVSDLVTSYTYTQPGNGLGLPAGLILTQTDPNLNVTTYAYYDSSNTSTTNAAFGQLKTLTEATGTSDQRVTTYTYDSATGNLASVTDPLNQSTNQSTSYTYDNLNEVTQITQPIPAGSTSAPTWTFSYSGGKVQSATDPLQHATSYGYDSRGRLHTVTLPVPGSTGLHPVWTYTYDSFGQLTRVTDADGNTTIYAYDSAGNEISKTLPNPQSPFDSNSTSPKWTYAYDNLGKLLSVTDPNQNTTSFAYDPLLRFVTITAPATTAGTDVTQINHDDVNRVVTTTDTLLGRTTVYRYDNALRLIQETDPPASGASGDLAPATTSYTYDGDGNVTSITTPSGQTQYLYDHLDRLIQMTQPATAQGQPVVTHYTYDAADNPKTLTDPNGNVTTWNYDNLGRLTSTSQTGLTGSDQYQYDLAGNLVQSTDRNNKVNTYSYDALNRMTSEQWLDSQTLTRTLTYTYDLVGNLTSASDPSAYYAYYFDKLYRPFMTQVYVTGGALVFLASKYDQNNNRTQLFDPLAAYDFNNTYTYNSLNEVTSVTQQDRYANIGLVAPKRVDFGYDAAGELTSLKRWSDLAGTQTVANSAYAYNKAGLVTSINTSGATVFNQGWYYDTSNRVTAYGSSADGQTNYSYDNLDQLTGANGAVAGSYAFDAAGNRTSVGSQNYTLHAGNQIASDGTFSYTYDNEGNQILRYDASGDARVMTYDHRNRLVEVQDYSSATVTNGQFVTGTPAQDIQYQYDVFNRMVSRTVNSNGSSTTQAFIYDGGNVLLEFSGVNGTLAPSKLYLNGPAVDQVLAQDNLTQPLAAASRVLWFVDDNVGTTRDLLDNTGAVAAHYTYDSFGRVLTGDTTLTQHLYTGAYYDTATGLQYNLNRWYDPSTGRWISQDPIGFFGGDYNLGRYVGNDPTNATDPSGLLVMGLIQLPAGSFWIGSLSGAEFSGSTSQELLDALNQIQSSNDTIDKLYLKGHANRDSINDWNGNPFCEITRDSETGKPLNKAKVRLDTNDSGTNVNILGLLQSVTNGQSTIYLNGCRTSALAQNLALMLANGTTVVGHPGGIWNIPGTDTYYIGPWQSYRSPPK